MDDLKYIHQRDGQDALGIAEKTWQQLQHQFETPQIDGQFENIVYAGMGGSALAALISKSWPGYKLPLELCRNYHIPNYVSNKTLFIASSYSGNTEETLSALAEAEKRGAAIAVISGGGQLAQIAREKHYPLLLIPETRQPRFGVLLNLKALAVLLEAANLSAEASADNEMNNAARLLQDSVAEWLPTVPTDNNPAKKLATEIAGKAPVIYSGPLLAPIAYKWKINFNENAKNIAWWNELPEFNHNEFIGWSSHPVQKPYSLIQLRSSLENPKINQRFEVSGRLLSGLWPHPQIIEAKGETILQQLCWTMVYGDFVSIYLALLNNQNPAPVDLVEKLKQEL